MILNNAIKYETWLRIAEELPNLFFLKVTSRKMVYDNPRTQMQLLAFMCWARDAAWPSKTTCQCASLANPWPNLRSSWRTLRFVLEELHPGVLTLNSIITTLESPPLILHSTQKKTYNIQGNTNTYKTSFWMSWSFLDIWHPISLK